MMRPHETQDCHLIKVRIPLEELPKEYQIPKRTARQMYVDLADHCACKHPVFGTV